MEKERITIEITDREGNVRQHSENDGHTELVWYGSYEPGDRIRVYALSDRFVRIQADQLLSPANVYIKKGCFDFPIPFGSAKEAYPHCTANVETRGEAIFAARNTIDGVLITPGHGFYPFTSWGNANDPASHIDLWFGRKVYVGRIIQEVRW